MLKPITGTWFEFHHHNLPEGVYWNPLCRQFSDRQWETKVEEIYHVLQGTPTALEWLTTYCWEKGWTFRTERSFSILSFGFNSAVDYLEESGRIASRQVGCFRRFIRRS